MKYRKLPLVFLLCFSGLLVTVLAVIAQQSATEAPAGFSTPSFNGAQSVSNGVVEPPGDTFALDQQHFEENEDIKAGLGPVYNATSCVTCHQNPVTGGPSQITEIRVGHKDQNGNFVNPTVLINDGQDSIAGRSIVNDRAICPQPQEHVPVTETIRTLRAVNNTLGDGFVEAIDDNTLIMADVGRKAIAQVKAAAREFLERRLSPEQAGTLAETLSTGQWTHDYPISAIEAKQLGLPVNTDMPDEVMELMSL